MSVEGIWNNALTILGAPHVTSTSDTTAQAVLINDIWEEFWESFLADHNWSRAKTTSVLTQLVDAGGDAVTPPTRWGKAFALPSSFIRAITLNGHALQPNSTTMCEINPISVDGVMTNALFTHDTDAELEYVFDVGNQVTLLQPQVRMACAHMLAAHIAGNFGRGDEQVAALRQQAELKLADAKAIDGQEHTPHFFAESPLLYQRRRWGGRR